MTTVATSSLALTAIAGCMSAEAAGTDPEATASATQAATVIGDPLPGTDAVAFAAARDNFAATEEIIDGLGPVFNEKACGNCHTTPVVGGSGVQIERRFGEFVNGTFYGYDQAQNDQGGTLRQLFSNGTYTNGNVTCTIPVEKEPADTTVHNVGRRTLPLFGLGLVDSIPDSFFDFLSAIEPSAQRGTVVRSIPLFPDARDPNQSFTAKRVNRFGIKDQETNLVSFAGDAYLNEMGISTQSCVRGKSVLAFAFDNQSNNVNPKAGCNMGDLAPAQPAGNPNVPQFTDDAVGDCAPGQSQIQDDLANFLLFMERLAPPPQDTSDPISFAVGAYNFANAGCINCHFPGPFVTPSAPFNGVPGQMAFFPFSDFLMHDMGSLGDLIGNTGDTVAQTRQMRTAPLWGARFNTQFLHDGRAKSVRAAILAHDGQGLDARNAFAAMSSSDQSFLIKFVNSI
ncbi:MAG TPA: di-heme oxidoredictase family protein [Kofleriaceae bacterium]|nr:di-heme oxidoredictase family protein [Kofleriaceae bacterium]